MNSGDKSEIKLPRVIIVTRCFIKRDDGKILIVQRASTDSHNPGIWEVPGGKLDEGQDITHSQEREVLEETSCFVSVTDRDCFIESFVCGSGKYIGIPYVAIYSITKLIGGDVTLSDEHDNYVWVTYGEMLNYGPKLDTVVRKAAIALRSKLEK